MRVELAHVVPCDAPSVSRREVRALCGVLVDKVPPRRRRGPALPPCADCARIDAEHGRQLDRLRRDAPAPDGADGALDDLFALPMEEDGGTVQ